MRNSMNITEIENGMVVLSRYEKEEKPVACCESCGQDLFVEDDVIEVDSYVVCDSMTCAYSFLLDLGRKTTL